MQITLIRIFSEMPGSESMHACSFLSVNMMIPCHVLTLALIREKLVVRKSCLV